MKLYGYWRSSAAYRVRIALNLKQLTYENLPVHLMKDGGQQNKDGYKALNPAKLVPVLVDGELTLNQSLAIIEYLDETYPSPQLLPDDPAKKAVIRALSLDITSDIHPLNNLRVLQYLSNNFGCTEQQKTQWMHHWLHTGFKALELRLQKTYGKYCFGDRLTLADICLVPQVYNALRFQLDMSAYPIISQIYHQCQQLAAFALAAPEEQPDAQ